MRAHQIQIPIIVRPDSTDEGADILHEKSTEQESTEPHTSNPLAEVEIDLGQLQSEWRLLLESKPLNGDAWYVVPRDFVVAALNTADESLTHLVSSIGPILNTSIVDGSGNMFPENEEPVVSMFVSPELYSLLHSYFGLRGEPVIRHILVDEHGTSALERFPPFFLVHLLCKTVPSTKASFHLAGLDVHSKYSFLLSQTKTFRDLMQIIESHMSKEKKSTMRLWFITTENVEELPANILVSVFTNKIQRKKIVTPRVLDCLLQSQGIRSSRLHLVVEPFDKVGKKFLMDQALSTINIPLLDIEKVMNTGGNLGLSNLGNTCYMNSALQCLVHVPEINYYFFYDLFEKELNRTNPLGNLGDVAVAFSNLLHKLFDFTGGTTTLITPREFKYTIGRYSSMFHGYQQQDSQEFLSWLLDALHEDLNRIQNKPYCEKPELKDEDVDNASAIVDLANQCWELHKKRNDSVIVDLFTGMYQSTLVCPACSKKSVTFDPFNDLTLPLPVNKKWYHEFTIVDLSGSYLETPIMKLEVELTKSSTYEDLVAYLSKHLLAPLEYLFLFEIFRNFFYKNFREESYKQSFLPVTELISDSDEVFVYIIPHTESDRIIPIVSTTHDEDKSYNITEPFGIPLFIVLNEEYECTDFGIISKKIADVSNFLSKDKSEVVHSDSISLDEQPQHLEGDKIMADKEETVFEKADTVKSMEITPDAPDVADNVSDGNYEIRYYREGVSKPASNLRRYARIDLEPSENDLGEQVLRIPRGRPLFGSLPQLSERLPKLYQDSMLLNSESELNLSDSQQSRTEINLPSNDDRNTEGIDKVLSEDDGDECKSYIMNDDEQRLLGENTDTETNWDNLHGIFASVDNLAPTENSSYPGSVSETQMGPESKIEPFCVDGNDLLVIDWNNDAYNHYFDHANKRLWEEISYVSNPELEANKRKLAAQQKATISLYDCLRNFSTPEVLGDQDLWYCPRCKDHRRATKTILVWSTGDILTIHLKRFQSARSLSDKINMVVDFPIEGLDITDFVTSSQIEGNQLVYDLIGVDNHYGGLGGGHYTATVKNFRDGKWYYFNDGRVTPLGDPKECVTGAAYLLFYKKRSANQFSGGTSVEEFIAKGRDEFEQKLASNKERLLQVMEEIEAYNWQEPTEADETQDEVVFSPKKDEENLYDDDDNETTELKPHGLSTSSKKSRSPVTEQNMKFENQRKQRLISKGSDLPRSVNINLNHSSSTSNLTSPRGSSEDEKEN